ncbi:hypothetical protein SDC9_149295 [bioreactor metagenome]|uniref:Pyridoxamine 5'-phosphate oxidase putative domain-containing protein n=1 Tax=bioreactor metagenome TaxID=1076179 RepID=A0A645ELD1_9ZZZZ|nr:pyridoxamine 5'-phosphate oxidase family protein [Christensenella sp.]
MRKEMREIKSLEEMMDLLSRCDTIRIGISDADAPYIVPVSFGYETIGGRIAVYFHGAQAGKRAELLKTLPRVCIEADLCHGFGETGGGYSCDYESLIGYGAVELLGGAEAEKGLGLLMEHCGRPGYVCRAEVIAVTAVNRVILDEVTGKRRNLKNPNA